MAASNTPLSILLIRNAAAYDFGGGERFPVYLAEQLIARGHRAKLVTAHDGIRRLADEQSVPNLPGPWWSRQDWSGKRVLLTPLYFGWQCYLAAWYWRLFRRERPDVIHAQSKDDFIAATIAARLLGIRVVWTDHADLKYMLQNLRVWYKNPVGKVLWRCTRWANHITLVSKSEKRLVAAATGKKLPAKFQVIYNGTADIPPVPFARNKRDAGAVIFAVTSRLVTAKGIGELIGAFQQINTARTYRLWILGVGPEEERFKTMAAGDTQIVFWGYPENALGFLQAADVFVHPSYHEGFSISIVEAAQLGKPIVACNVGGNPEIITDGKSGLLIPASDQAALAAAMQRLADKPNLRTLLGATARKQYEQRFRFDTIVQEQFIPLYEK